MRCLVERPVQGGERRFDFDVGKKVLDEAGKAAFERYLDLGGNFVGIHSASDALRNTTWFIHEVGECPFACDPCQYTSYPYSAYVTFARHRSCVRLPSRDYGCRKSSTSQLSVYVLELSRRLRVDY